MEQNVFGFQNEPLLTLKDPRVFGYQRAQSECFLCRYHNQGMVEKFLDEACEDDHGLGKNNEARWYNCFDNNYCLIDYE